MGLEIEYNAIPLAIQLDYLVGYWRLNEASGTTAADSSGNSFDGTATSITWGAMGMGDGETAATFNGTTGEIDVFSAGFAALFDGTAIGVLVWGKIDTAALTDGQVRVLFRAYVDASNYVMLSKSATNNTIVAAYMAGGTLVEVSATISDSNYHTFGVSVDASADTLILYVDGVSVDTANTLGTWSGTITSAFIGSSDGAQFWDGDAAHVALWNTALSANDMSALAMNDLITPIYDRTLTDVITRVSKAFFNVADWARIHANTELARDRINTVFGLSLLPTYADLTAPTLGAFVSVSDINKLARNIYAIRHASIPSSALISIVYLWGDKGQASTGLSYDIVNAWEYQLYLLFYTDFNAYAALETGDNLLLESGDLLIFDGVFV